MNSHVKFSRSDKANSVFCMLIMPLLLAAALFSCSNDDDPGNAITPFMLIEEGQFSVEVLLNTDTSNQDSTFLGAGTISFDFSGDTSGAFFASGPLYLNQRADSTGVGALLDRIFNAVFGGVDEGLSLLAIVPVGNGKVDVLTIGTRLFEPVDTLQVGVNFGIGPNAPFIAAYFKGLQITDFWDGASNFFEASDRAFSFVSGRLTLTERDSTHVSGEFIATTDPQRSSNSGAYLLK